MGRHTIISAAPTSRRPILAVVALAAMLSTTGCFTVIGTGIGAIADGGHQPQQQPRVRRAPEPPPPDSFYFDPSLRAAHTHHVEPVEDDGPPMSATDRGFYIGAALDLAVVGLAVLAYSISPDLNFCEDGC